MTTEDLRQNVREARLEIDAISVCSHPCPNGRDVMDYPDLMADLDAYAAAVRALTIAECREAVASMQGGAFTGVMFGKDFSSEFVVRQDALDALAALAEQTP